MESTLLTKRKRKETYERNHKLGLYKKGWKNPPRTGEYCKQLSERMLGDKNPMSKLKGPLHPNWQGGPKNYPKEFNEELKEQIRQRDGYRCQECFREQSELRTKSGRKYKLIVHHIDYNKKNCNGSNLISLCMGCHGKTCFNRNDWFDYFNDKGVN